MVKSIKSKHYWIRIIPILVWQILYLITCSFFSKYTRVYCDLVFYSIIAICFLLWRDWCFLEWGKAIKQGKIFWRSVLFTALGMAIMYCISFGLALIFPNSDDGMSVFGINNWASLVAFAIVTILLAPIAEEVFYRKSVIAFDSKAVIIISTIISVMLYASEHSLMPLGFLQACLWSVPLSIAYLRTKNIYVCMTAHLLCNLIVNGITVVDSAIKLSS